MKFVVALTGASGQIVGLKLVERLKEHGEVYVITTRAARVTLKVETDFDEMYVKSLATKYYDEDEIHAPLASGSFKFDAMAIVPCSMKTASAIANGFTDNLITRAADVALKERRKLLLAVREAPMNAIHLRNLAKLSEIGAIVFPLVMSFYTRPKNLEEMITFTVSRIMELLGVEVEYKRYELS
ncbi:MAG: UbiX family flavin prenyltransferase [Archaeoglobaceae archaeon]|nr:UbiX family flavin prenyltransferase [Archaeoglobaceae archaeon]MCX8151627.1 UbiX family flavin prenyltransferase [Archaeoglobaceae archaeon]MDW8013095.1 UbiX family flavin prenyltransferase [Archaeoglobaceae archaeon]